MINLSGLSNNIFFPGDNSIAHQNAAISWYKANNIGSITLGWQIPINPATGAIVASATNPAFPSNQFVGTTLADIQAFAQQATSNGLQVVLKPYFINSATAMNIGAPGANENLAAITATMGSYLPQVAKVAQSTHASAIILGTENSALQTSSYTSFWQTAIQAVRESYSGLLGYAATYFPFHSPYVANFPDVRQIAFASLLDFVGADVYLPVAAEGVKATYDQAVAAWTVNLKTWWPNTANVPGAPDSINILADLKSISEAYGKPLVLTETGYPSSTIASYNPSNIGGTLDLQQQAVLAQAQFDVLKKAGDWLAGAIWFGGNAFDFDPNYNPNNSLGWDVVGKPVAPILTEYVNSVGNGFGAPHTPAAAAILDDILDVLRWSSPDFGARLVGQANTGQLDQLSAVTHLLQEARATSSVATLAYEFFTGKSPSAAGMDYLVSPTGPNPNNLNSPYFQNFSLENRYINFAVNLGSAGEGKDAFTATYGGLSLFEATRTAYAKIFGEAPSDAKLHAILDPTTVLNGQTFTRADYFAYYGQDGANGVGAKAAMVGFLLAEAIKANVGVYAKSNDAFLTDVALHDAPFGVDLVGVYAQPGFVFHPG